MQTWNFFDKVPFEAHEIIDGVWLGSYDAATAEWEEFEKRQIKYVLTVGFDLV